MNFKVFGVLKKLPELIGLGIMELDEEITKEADAFSASLKFDEYQAIITRPLAEVWKEEIWNYKKAKYSYITTLRKHGKPVEVITANILVFTEKNGKKYLVLQKRSNSSGLYAGYYSVFGGAFSPELDRGDLIKTAIRELHEEINGIITPDNVLRERLNNAGWLLTHETDNGNLQINFVGVDVELSPDATGSEDEGKMYLVEWENIEEFIDTNHARITPLALANIYEEK